MGAQARPAAIRKGIQAMKLNKIVITASLAGLLGIALPGYADSELTAAIKVDDTDAVRTLVQGDVDVNAHERDGTTPLQWAVYHENAAAVAALLAAGADVELANREGMTPLVLAAQTGNAEIAKLLLDTGAGVNNTLPNGESPLMMAARTGDVATIQLLLDRGANINAQESLRGTSALMWAAANRNAPAVSLLLDNGADGAMRSIATNIGRTEPYLAPTARTRIREFYQNSGISRAVDKPEELRGEDYVSPDASRQELLQRLPEELVRQFEAEQERAEQREQVDPQQQKKRRGGLSALHFAVREGDLATVQALVGHGADVNQVSEFGWTPLLTATQNRYYQLGKYLLENGADPNVASEGGWNPLYIATDNRNIEGGDYPTRKPDMNHIDYIKLLLEAGADPNLRMKSSTETRTIFTHQWLREEGATPFLRAAQSSDLELMKLLLEYGADPNINSRVGVTPLMVAAGIGWVEGVTFEWSEEANEEALRWLIELGNDVNAQDEEDYRTALMGAAHKGRTYAINILVEAGAKLDTHDIGSRDTLNNLTGVTWQAIDYADGLVRVGVQSAEAHPEAAARLRELMTERGLEVPPEGRTLDSICVVDICR